MTLQLANVTFDCDAVLPVAEFWSAALERPVDADPSDFFASIGAADSDRPSFFFAKVPEGTLSQVRSQAWQVETPLR